jgi:NAD-dependent dihydropyrimidine dehydrogenase PreA subunit
MFNRIRNKSIVEYDISEICKICEENPNSHSFKEIKVYDNTSIMYTCPANAIKYNDKDGILRHYRNVLDRLKRRLLF